MYLFLCLICCISWLSVWVVRRNYFFIGITPPHKHVLVADLYEVTQLGWGWAYTPPALSSSCQLLCHFFTKHQPNIQPKPGESELPPRRPGHVWKACRMARPQVCQGKPTWQIFISGVFFNENYMSVETLLHSYSYILSLDICQYLQVSAFSQNTEGNYLLLKLNSGYRLSSRYISQVELVDFRLYM